MCRSARLPLLAALLSLFASVGHAATPSPTPDSLQPLLATMYERLNIGDLAALTKWDNGKPIQDNAREALVIADARKQAMQNKVNPDEFADLIAAQIEASKVVQYGRIAQWQAAGKAPTTPRQDLEKQIRPQLDQLQKRLLQQYAAFSRYRTDPDCPHWLGKTRATLIKDQLHGQALIRASGELCAVGR